MTERNQVGKGAFIHPFLVLNESRLKMGQMGHWATESNAPKAKEPPGKVTEARSWFHRYGMTSGVMLLSMVMRP